MTYLDYIFIFLLLVSTFRGWCEGVVRSLLGICTIIIGYIAAFVYFRRHHDWVTSFFIAVISSLVLEFILSLFFRIWSKFTRITKPNLISSLLGGILGFVSGMFLLSLFLIFLVSISLGIPLFKEMQDIIKQSKAYHYVSVFKQKSIDQQEDLNIILESINDPDKLKSFESMPEYRELIQDPRIQDLLSDETTQKQIKDRQILKLLANPKFQAILKNKELVNKFLALEMLAIKKQIKQKNDKSQDLLPDAELSENPIK